MEAPKPEVKEAKEVKDVYSVVVLGPPACGKGIVCNLLEEKLGLVRLSTVSAP